MNTAQLVQESETEWRGITYPRILDFEFVQRLWERFCCPREWHLFDETESVSLKETRHYLYCDACGLSVHIDHFGFEEEI